MADLRLTIPGEPMAQPRVRVAVIAGRARAYQPKAAASWKGAARDAMTLALKRAGLSAPFVPSGPVALALDFRFTMPKSQHLKREPRRGGWHAKRPDIDNCIKAVMDAAKGILWLDDTQVARLQATKVVADQGAAPGIVLIVRPMDEREGDDG